MTLLASLMLFGCGVLCCLAWTAGLYASAVLASLAAFWLAGTALWRQMRPEPVRVTRVSRPSIHLDLETTRRRLQSMLDQAPVPLLTLSADGILRVVNRAARHLFGTDERMSDAPASLREAVERARPGERTALKLPSCDASGPQRSYALSVADSVGPEGAGRLVVLTDIEAEIQAAEAAALRDLLQVLSHEIMNSLTPVASLAESAQALLSTGAADDAAQAAGALETIMRRARGLDQFVQGYRMLARLPPPVLRPASVAALLTDAASLFRSQWTEQDVILVFDAPDPDIIASLDPDLLLQALLNLLGNAAEAACAGSARPGWIELSGFARHGGVAFRIVDSGDGVPAGQEEAIFRPFVTLRAGGSGIGLSLARQIAQSHGGSLILERTTTGGGASFLLHL